MLEKQTDSLKAAVVINGISKYSKMIINLIFTVILARLLSAEDYGIVAVANVFINFFLVFSDMGISAAVIQNKDLTKEDNNNLYTFTIYLGILLSIIFALCSIPMSYFYKDSVYISIGVLLSLSLLFSTFNMVPNALIMKDKQFLNAGVRQIISSIFSGIITVLFALMGLKYYSIVIANILYSLLIFLWNRKYAHIKFVRKLDWKSVKKIRNFSAFQFAYSFVNFFSRNLDSLLTGRYMGSAPLGYYNKAYSLTQYPISAVSNVVSPALHPILSEHQSDKQYIYKKYIDISKIFLILGIFISFFCVLADKEIIIIMYGTEWTESISCFKWLGISIWSQLAISSVSSIFQSMGDTKRLFCLGNINVVISVIFVIAGIYCDSILYLSICMSINYMIQFVTSNIMLIRKAFGYSMLNFIKNLLPEILILAVLCFMSVVYPIDISNIWISILVKFVYYAFGFLIILFITGEHKLFNDIINPFLKKMRRQRENLKGSR